MPSPHCRCSDGTCKALSVEPVPGSGGVSIRRSVGANGANDPQDSKTIQDALNSVADGRVDPNGPSINRLNLLLASGPAISSAPIGVTPDTMASFAPGCYPR